MQEKESLSVVNDQWGSLTYTPALARYVVACLETQPEFGVYHCTAGGNGTWFDVATQIAKHIGYKGELSPIATTAYPRPAKRPLNGRLSCDKFDKAVGIQRISWQDNLATYLNKE